jgi:vacuolar-type H+-ATPase subunit I/STV1
MPSIKRDSIITLIFCLIVGGYVIMACQGFPEAQDSQGFGQGPGFYPQVLGWSLIILGVLTLIYGLKTARELGPYGESIEKEPSDAKGASPRYGLVLAALVLSLADIVIMHYLGFFVAGFVLVLAMVMMIRPPHSLKTVVWDLVFSAGMVAVVYLVFEAFIKIQLPRAALFG